MFVLMVLRAGRSSEDLSADSLCDVWVCIYLIHYLLLFSSTVLGCLLIIIEFLALCSFVCKCCMECEFKYTVMALYGEMSSCLPRHISFTGKKKTTGNCSMRLGIQPQGCSYWLQDLLVLGMQHCITVSVMNCW